MIRRRETRIPAHTYGCFQNHSGDQQYSVPPAFFLEILSANRVYSDKGKLGALVPSSGQGLAFRQTCDYPWVGTTGASVKLG